MMKSFTFLLSSLIGALSVYASPIDPRQSITTLSTAQISSFKPFSFFAAAAYCDPDKTLKWNCGGKLFVSVRSVLCRLFLVPQSTVGRIPISFLLPLEEMAPVFSFVSFLYSNDSHSWFVGQGLLVTRLHKM